MVTQPASPDTEKDSRPTSLHSETEEPPPEFRRDCKAEGDPIGPIVGSRTSLGFALHGKNDRSDVAYRDQFHHAMENRAVWVRGRTNARTVEMFVRSFAQLHKLKKRVDMFEKRKLAKASES